eukprot:10602909-Alexandrium_andersonii.AAC.1
MPSGHLPNGGCDCFALVVSFVQIWQNHVACAHRVFAWPLPLYPRRPAVGQVCFLARGGAWFVDGDRAQLASIIIGA